MKSLETEVEFLEHKKKRPCISRTAVSALAAETAQLAQKLPDEVAIKVKHLADLQISICLAKTIEIVTVL